MIWQKNQWVRRIYMTDKHSEHVKPSWFGESIAIMSPTEPLWSTPSGSRSQQLSRLVPDPAYRKGACGRALQVSPDGRVLEVLVKVEDPETFNETLYMVQRWRKVPTSYRNRSATENNGDHFRGEPLSHPGGEEVRFLIEAEPRRDLGSIAKQRGKTMSDEELKAELERLRNENAALKKGRLPVSA